MRKIRPLDKEFVEELSKRSTEMLVAAAGRDVHRVLNKLEFDELIQILMRIPTARISDMHYFAILELIRRDLTPVQKKTAAWFYYASPSNKQDTSVIFSLKERMAISKLLEMAKGLTYEELVEIGAQ